MPANKLSDLQIAITVVPMRTRWPESGTSVAWTKAHDCVDSLQEFVRKVDRDCLQAEQNEELSVEAIRRRRAEIYDRAMLKLTNFGPFQIAEKAVSDTINSLERLSNLNSEQAQMLEALKRMLGDLEEGISATQRMLQERCRVRERVSA